MNSRKGFTLIELLIVILILGALAAIAIPRITASADNAKIRACQTNIDLMNTQIELYAADHNDVYPATLATITGNTNYFPDGPPKCNAGGTYSMSANHRVSCSIAAHND
ncbi:MAG: prepilin-type N-terminal cleavage/methylation domain-containing protein [Phycisphaerae bacterium]|jgi:prepilin-type N-terminal cleavage/methylation domain-containing protein